MPLTAADLKPYQGTDYYRIISAHNLPVRDTKLGVVSLQLLSNNWEPYVGASSNTVTPQPAPFESQSLDGISILWEIAAYLKDCHLILSFKRGRKTRWLHCFIIGGEVCLKESGEFKWMREGFFKTKKQRQQHKAAGN